MSEERSDSVASIAGVIMDAVREGLGRTLTPEQHSQILPGAAGPSGIRQTVTADNLISLYQHVYA